MTPKITKAVIPVAGWATRFMPTVKSYAKHLVPIVDKPQIQLVVEELLGAGITDLCIVYREGETTIKDYFTPNPVLEDYLKSTGKESRLDSWRAMMAGITRLTMLPQPQNMPYGNGVPIIVSQEFIGSDPFIYLWGDDLTLEDKPGHFISEMLKLYDQYNPDIILGAQEVPWEEVEKYGTMKYHPEPKIPNQVIDVPEKLPRDLAPSNIINGARFIVTPKVIEVLKKLELDRGELWFTQAASAMAKTGTVITANYKDYGAVWAPTGDPLSWLKANIMVAMKNPAYADSLRALIS
ncbi:MAG TPA: sugar phosphate nucleotidyltransferase [Patescibacteria group bacterium]